MSNPTPKRQDVLTQPVAPDKWQAQRDKERITLQDHKFIPHRNTTTTGTYTGSELRYRGQA